MTVSNHHIIAVVGPTCTGKSRIAGLLAQERGGPVLSADALQVYRGMDIGTGKAFDSFGEVPVFGVDLVEPSATYSASLYQEYGRTIIETAREQKQDVIVCGGSGLYIRALLDDMEFAAGKQDENPIRQRYQQLYETEGAQAVWDVLYEKDASAAAVIHPNNVKRVIRALEMAEEGESYAQRAELFSGIQEKYPALYVAFSLPRELLYERINARVDMIVDAGLVAEVSQLKEQGLPESSTAHQAIGYKEILAYLDGACTLDESITAIKQATRRYAKRQISWFGRDSRVHWIDGLLSDEEKLQQINDLLKFFEH